MLAKTLRDDQAKLIEDVRSVMRETRRAVVQAPTGYGKTVVITDIVGRGLAKDKRVLITVPALSLIQQTVEALASQGMRDVGVIQADHPMTDWSRPVQVCSVQTLERRWRDNQMPKADLVLVDEVHRMSKLFTQWIPSPEWQKVPFLGFSATPWSKGLGTMYDRLLVGATTRQLIHRGVLVSFRTFAPDTPDMTGVRTTGGDWNLGDLDRVMRPKKLVANIVETWMEQARDRPTVCFCCSRAHAEQVAEEFEKAGIGSGYLDCDTPQEERDEIRRRMLAGEVKVVCNVEVIGIGVDWPEVSCIIYARPTKSDIRFVQNIGRGLRMAPGKTDLLILDHSSTTQRLGFVDDIPGFHEGLDDGAPKEKAEKGVALPKLCTNCHLLKPPRTAVCPHCGFKIDVHANPVLCERGTLREIAEIRDALEAWRQVLPEAAHCFGQLWWWAKQKGYKPGFAAVKYKDIFGSWPRARVPDADKIGPAVPALAECIYAMTDAWVTEQKNASRRASGEVKDWRGRMKYPSLRVVNAEWYDEFDEIVDEEKKPFVGETLMTEEDMEDFK